MTERYTVFSEGGDEYRLQFTTDRSNIIFTLKRSRDGQFKSLYSLNAPSIGGGDFRLLKMLFIYTK